MVGATTMNIATTFTGLLNNVQLKLEPFNMNRCDERTLYVPVSLHYKDNSVQFDIIYLVDKQELFGAISLNDYYDKARDFFTRHFNYDLYYHDEQHLAKMVSSSPQFKKYLQQYAATYPKHVENKTFPLL